MRLLIETPTEAFEVETLPDATAADLDGCFDAFTDDGEHVRVNGWTCDVTQIPD